MSDKIRIKDIAERAGVSVGTVDRVLHNRANVSKKAVKQVQAALKEMNYRPNMYASALAYNKQYLFFLLIPKHGKEAYWDEVEEGVKRCEQERSDFQIDVKTVYYDRADSDSLVKAGESCLEQKPDGVILVPTTLDSTRKFTDQLHEANIPFVMLDSYMPDLRPLAFFGQDSFQSGYFAARMFMLLAFKETAVMLMKQTNGGQTVSKQQANREVGFRHYMSDHYPDVKILELQLDINDSEEHYDQQLEKFFTAHPEVHHCITLGAHASIVGSFLLRTNRRDVQIMGYDFMPQNNKCMREGSISFLVCQHAFMQGYYCVDTLFRAIVLKQEVQPVNYMPIELLTPENIDFYRRMSY
ncbi:MAG: LacI family DNA-binding transcriptional regulator [Prevotella sp.]|jgi:LacI family transcriptional regulator